MGRRKLTTELAPRGTHFTWAERLLLQYYYNGTNNYPKITSATQLGRIFGKHESTIRREIKRGKVEHLTSHLETVIVYNAEYAHNDAMYKATAKGPDIKLGNDIVFVKKVEKLIKEKKHSPYAVIEFFNINGWPSKTRICDATLYNYINAGYMGNISKEDLLYKGRRKKPLGKPKRHSRAANAQKSIEFRPAEVEKRDVFGHWEGDTIVGPRGGTSECLYTMTERKSRLQIIVKLASKTKQEVEKALDEVEKKLGAKLFKKIFKTCTTDNGSEFSGIDEMELSKLSDDKRLTVYFARPYKSSDRATNENHNGIIRRFIPKGTNIDLVESEKINYIKNWMNNYPRKVLKGITPLMAFAKEFEEEILLDKRILEVFV